ncbi:MAG: hypothetical protein IKF39_12200 [Oscillospiraceae bacterium]|nr:hypothetical protein [Oscillospiraceae bacterium]
MGTTNIWILLLYSLLGMLVVFFAWRVRRLKDELRQIEEENAKKAKEKQQQSVENSSPYDE